MPYKNKEKQRKAMRRIMREHRAKEKQKKQQAQRELLQLITEAPQIKQKIPSVLDIVLGKRKKRKG